MKHRYYYLTKVYYGDHTILSPDGYYERIEKNSLGHDDISFWWLDGAIIPSSNVKEIRFARSPHAGLFVIGRELEPGRYFVYETNEVPDVDLSHSNLLDFPVTGEVRYRRPISASLVGVIHVTNELNRVIHKTIKRCYVFDSVDYDHEFAKSVLNEVQERYPMIQVAA